MKKTPNWRPKWLTQGQRKPTSYGGTWQTWTRCGLHEPGGIQREGELPQRHLSGQRRSGSQTCCFYWPNHPWFYLAGTGCFGSPIATCSIKAPTRWTFTRGDSQATLPKVGLFGKGCSSLVRSPQRIFLSLVPVAMEDLLWLVSWKERCSSQRLCTCSRGLSDPLTPGQGLVRLRC